ncbi:hypothetical protein OURE66S_04501 [Oligella ureolytica]
MQNSSEQTNYSDEIDLFELFGTIWRGKWTIIAITIVAIILAALYAFTAKEQWTAKAQMRAPEQQQLQTYIDIQQAYNRLQNPGSTIDVNQHLGEAFTLFGNGLFSQDDRLEAVRNSIYYKTESELLDDEVAKINLLAHMASKELSISEAEGAGNRALYNLSFSATTPVDAQTTLIQIIQYMNKKTLDSLYERLKNRINYHLLSLEAQSQSIKDNTDQVLENKLLQLQQALQSAQTSGIDEYTGSNPIAGNSIIDLKNSDTLFMLGENYLEAQLETLTNTPPIYPADYYEILRNTESLKTLLTTEIEGQVFTYTDKPKLPLVKDKPRKALILVLGALLGAVIGVFYVLLRSAINNRKSLQIT